MISTEVYETSDGLMFKDKMEAIDHQHDIIGILLDDLLPYDDRGNISNGERHRLVIKLLYDPLLKSKIAALSHALSFIDD